MPSAVRLPLILTRLSGAIRRVFSCVATSPLLCLRLLLWRASLPVLKYVVPIRVLARWMWAAPSRSNPLRNQTAQARRDALLYVWQNGGRLFVSANCLEKSLVLYRLLSREGADPNLVFGVNRHEDGVAGHAWIETKGRVFPVGDGKVYERLAMFGVN